MTAAATARDWPGYFRAYVALLAEQAPVEVPQPEPEVTTLMPPDPGFVLPGGAATLLKKIQAAGWEAHSGYSRASRKGVRLNEWVLCHYAGIWGQRGSQRVYGRWWARVQPEGVPLKWAWDKGSVNGWHAEKVGDIVAALAAGGGSDG